MTLERFYLSRFSAPQLDFTVFSIAPDQLSIWQKKKVLSFLVFKVSSLAFSALAAFFSYQLTVVGFAGMPSNFYNIIYVMRGPLFVWDYKNVSY